MKIATFTIGCSASGKSKWATESIENTGSVIIERDNIRLNIIKERHKEFNPNYHNMWKFWKFNKENEQEVTEIVNQLRDLAILKGNDIIFSNTNLNSKYLNKDIEYMKSKGYTINIKAFPVQYDELLKRDKNRQHSVGESVINKQWLDWLKLDFQTNGIKKYVKDTDKRKAIIVDVDGTVAQHTNRGPFEYGKVLSDSPIKTIIDLVNRYKTTHTIIFLSGRDSVCRADTFEWLSKYFEITMDQLLMRPNNNFKKDRIIKEQLFWKYIAPHYCVDLVIDDRKQVVQLWTDMSYTLNSFKVINVGNFYEEF